MRLCLCGVWCCVDALQNNEMKSSHSKQRKNREKNWYSCQKIPLFTWTTSNFNFKHSCNHESLAETLGQRSSRKIIHTHTHINAYMHTWVSVLRSSVFVCMSCNLSCVYVFLYQSDMSANIVLHVQTVFMRVCSYVYTMHVYFCSCCLKTFTSKFSQTSLQMQQINHISCEHSFVVWTIIQWHIK